MTSKVRLLHALQGGYPGVGLQIQLENGYRTILVSKTRSDDVAGMLRRAADWVDEYGRLPREHREPDRGDEVEGRLIEPQTVRYS